MPPKKKGTSKASSILSRNRPNKNKAKYKDEDSINSEEDFPSSRDVTESDTCSSVTSTDGGTKNTKSRKKKGATKTKRQVLSSDDEDTDSAEPVKGIKNNRQQQHSQTSSRNKSSSIASSSAASDSGHQNLNLKTKDPDAPQYSSFREIVEKMFGMPDLTKNLDQDGRLVNYITKTPELQEVERELILELSEMSAQMEREHENLLLDLIKINAVFPKTLMNMSMDTVSKMAEKVLGNPLEDINFLDIAHVLKGIKASDIEKIISDDDLKSASFNTNEKPEDLWSPKSDTVSTTSGGLLSISSASKVARPATNIIVKHVFPSTSEMIGHDDDVTPPEIYKFGGSLASSSSKAPRLVKPGEIAYSYSGSPLLIPRLGGWIDKPAERIPLSDQDGKKIVEVVLYKGEKGTDKDVKDFATDIRGIVALKTIKKDKFRPPRILPKTPGSAQKKPIWH